MDAIFAILMICLIMGAGALIFMLFAPFIKELDDKLNKEINKW